MSGFDEARDFYGNLGVDVDAAMKKCSETPVSIHCWQGDDVEGFDGGGALSGGIQTTGNYPGKARTPDELMADFDEVLKLVPGRKKLNLHASYAIFGDGDRADRDKISPRHFKKWVDYANARGIGVDFNPTFFSHSMVKDNLTLSSPDETVRRFWIEHGKRCVEISSYFAEETGMPCLMNIWIPDGFKDIPGDRFGPRKRFADSLDEIVSVPRDKTKVYICLESKVFGIGLESCTVGSAEFCLNYVNSRGITPLMDNGHYHPTESVADKISAMLLFNDKIALHITRPVRWDSDHVVLFDDETRSILGEVVACDALDRVFLATDYFDASVNRVAAWVTGQLSVRKAMLQALLTPYPEMRRLQDSGDFTHLMALREKLNCAPFYPVWEEFLNREGVNPDYMSEIDEYERKVSVERL